MMARHFRISGPEKRQQIRSHVAARKEAPARKKWWLSGWGGHQCSGPVICSPGRSGCPGHEAQGATTRRSGGNREQCNGSIRG
jgi:hypothetical protein